MGLGPQGDLGADYLAGLLALLHARRVGWVRDLGLAAWSVVCFVLVLMTWYVVNFVLGGGLHSYGSGTAGGNGYILAVVAIQFLYVAQPRCGPS